jgi:hypothetical protein
MNSRRFMTARYHIAPRDASLIPIFFTTRTPCRSAAVRSLTSCEATSERNLTAKPDFILLLITDE